MFVPHCVQKKTHRPILNKKLNESYDKITALKEQ